MMMLLAVYAAILFLMPWALVEYLRTRKRAYAMLSALAAIVVLCLFGGFIFFGPNSQGNIHNGSELLQLMGDPYFLFIALSLSAGPAVVWGIYRDRHAHSG